MEQLKVLDCTLRDGGYYTNWDFDDVLVEHYLEAVNHLPIDYVEVGYRSKEIGGYFGPYFYTSTRLIKSIAAKLKTAQLALMIDVKNTSVEDIPVLFQDIVEECQLVRMAVAPDKLQQALPISAKLKDMGFKTAINLMYMSKVEVSDQLLQELAEASDLYDYIYLVDSYGGMSPDEVSSKFKKCEKLNVLGFHGHNNLELALANTMAAINSGVGIVDATITGMGRGAGNLKTELLLTYLQSKSQLDANLNKLSEVVKRFDSLRKEYGWGTNLPYMLSGAYNLPQKDVMEWLSTNRYTVNTIVHSLLNESDQASYPELQNDQIDQKEALYIIGGGPSVSKVKEDLIEHLAGNDKALIYHSSSRYANDLKQYSSRSLIGLAGSEADKLTERIGKEKVKEYHYLLSASPREMQTDIPVEIAELVRELPNSCSEFGDSPIGIGFDLARLMGLKKVYLLGFDGYDQPTNEKLNLMNENQTAMDQFVQLGGEIIALTKTNYSGVIQKSVYSKFPK